MAWPYHFVSLDDDEIQTRRELLDRYGIYAQLSAPVPVLAYQLYIFASWVFAKRERAQPSYTAVPSSPKVAESRISPILQLARKWRRLSWWFGSEVYAGYGTNGQWISGLSWASWLIFLCIHQTGIDYLHVTKRFGIVAASQFPLHYLLSMKSVYSPLVLAFRTSHEKLNTYHRISGRIIYSLLMLHGIFYLNFFYQAGLVKTRLTSFVVIVGVISFALLTVLAGTSLARVRRWSYRLFFVLHLTLGISILPLLFFHASPLRLYVVEAAVLFILDIIARKLDTVTGYAKITLIPGTRLIKLVVPVPASKIERFRAAAAQHVYLSIPPPSTPSTTHFPSIHDLLFNPFTVADVSESAITIVLRVLKGPTSTALEHLTQLSKATPPINIEGPCGTSQQFSNLATQFDRILLVAGGVGATYTFPIYKHIQRSWATEGSAAGKISLVWSMKVAAEAVWAAESEDLHVIQKDPNIRIFLTGPESVSPESPLPEDSSVEKKDLQIKSLDNAESGRPDLKQIVDSTLRHAENEKVAILVCGPAEMARELREHAGEWVARGRHIWWHDESFGW
ncbi:MAG: hypothetical protein M1818_000659 [Claussenomyces sp. TS43310]|nr:MAG: hypothetical protein M1818_000659 [Claussenomyces sp. TS43310]